MRDVRICGGIFNELSLLQHPHSAYVERLRKFGIGSSFVKKGKKFLLLLLVLIFARDPILIALIVSSSRQCCMNEGELWLSLHIQLMEDKNGRQKKW